MKLVMAAAAAIVLTTTAAFAQPSPPATPALPAAPAAPTAPATPSRCPAFPAEPTLPDGATARNMNEMNRGNETYQAWGTAMQSVLECRRAEAQELRTAAQAAMALAEVRVQEFNGAVARLTAVGTAWQAEAEEFNTRRGRR